MSHFTLFITGSDTGVGKTTLAVLLVVRLRSRGVNVRAIKPVSSGRRADARSLASVQSGCPSTEEINPWHFRAPLAPALAARLENRTLTQRSLCRFVRAQQAFCDVLIVEGAGGILSPIGENVDARDLIVQLDPLPIVVCPNRLGAINQALLAIGALPPRARRKSELVLVQQRKPDPAADGNVAFLKELIGNRRVKVLPWLGHVRDPKQSLRRSVVRAAIDAILEDLI